jgi:hypothetical protein
VESARDVLREIDAGTTDARIMERPTNTSVGSDLTPQFDLSNPAVQVRTRGMRAATEGTPPGEGYDRAVGVSRADLEVVARRIIDEGLPPLEPGAVRSAVTSGPGRREREPETVPAD